ncbi:MAG: replication initiator protein A [Bryobacterales bacterium]|nr:replication initiator protein A [Bryobacterales bacterium]
MERVDLIRADPERCGERLGFTSRPFVLCGLPMRRPPRRQLLFERQNGKFKLQLLGHPDFGLPFGQDRLILIFLATLAVRQQSQTLQFRSGAEMLEMFGMQKGGQEYRRLVAGIERIFGSTIFFGSERTTQGAKLFSRARFHFVRETHIWFDRDSSRSSPAEWRENVIVLSDEFFREIIQHPIPTDLEAIRLLAASPGALDLYLWVTYRSFTAKPRQSIPLFGPQGLQGQLGCTEYSRPRRFRAMLMQWMTAIAPVCPKLRRMVQVSRECLELRGEERQKSFLSDC